jgi:hypothetical protein
MGAKSSGRPWRSEEEVMNTFEKNALKALATTLILTLAMAAGPLALANAAPSHGTSAAASTDQKKLLDDASFGVAPTAGSTDQKKLLDDASFGARPGATTTVQKKLLDDASYTAPGHPVVANVPPAPIPALVPATNGASWFVVWGLASALAVTLAVFATTELRRRRPALGV